MQNGPAGVLVVDDEPTIRMALKRILRSAGVRVETAEDGVCGLQAVRALRPAVVILDVMMPGLDGISVCRQVKGDPALPGTTVIVLTASAAAATREQALAAGADVYLTKPFAPRELVAHVAAALGRAAAA